MTPHDPEADFHLYLTEAREALLWKLDGAWSPEPLATAVINGHDRSPIMGATMTRAGGPLPGKRYISPSRAGRTIIVCSYPPLAAGDGPATDHVDAGLDLVGCGLG